MKNSKIQSVFVHPSSFILHPSSFRPAFTIVELMVSMALTLFILTILSQAFVISIDTYSQLKSVGDIEGNLRSAAAILRHDLQQDHFETKRRLSDPGWWSVPFQEGFFYFNLISPTSEGSEDGIASYRAGSGNVLHFSSKYRGNQPDRIYSASVGSSFILKNTNNLAFQGLPTDSLFQTNSGILNSRWAEIAYALKPTSTTSGGTQLYALYRTQFVVISRNDEINPNGASLVITDPFTNYLGVSCYEQSPNSVYFNTPADLAIGFNNRAYNKRLPNQRPESLVLTDLISFEIQTITNTSFPNFSPGPMTFDTSSLPNVELKAIQINLRIWDRKTEQTRQISIVQDL